MSVLVLFENWHFVWFDKYLTDKGTMNILFLFLGNFFLYLSLLRKMAFDCLHQILALKQKFNFIQTFFILRLFIYCVQDWKNANLKPSWFYLRKKWCKIVTIKPRKRNIMFTPVICRFCCTLHNDRTKIT